MVKKFTGNPNRFVDETTLMTAQQARNKPGRPIKGPVRGAQYSMSWGDLRRVYAALKKGYLTTEDERAQDALDEALRILHRRTAGRLELEDSLPIPEKGKPKNIYEITHLDGSTEEVEGADAAAEKFGVSKQRLCNVTKNGGTLTKTITVYKDKRDYHGIEKPVYIRRIVE